MSFRHIARGTKRSRFALRALGVSLAGIAAVGISAPNASAETRGFIVSWFAPALYYGDGDCPEGVRDRLDWNAIFTREGKSPAEIKELIDHPLSPKFIDAAIHRGPHGEDVCANPTTVADEGMKTVTGKIGYGLNLDGTTDGHATPKTCAHQKFISPEGDPGVDNQLYRVVGCDKSHRGQHGTNDGFAAAYVMARMKEGGLKSFLIEINGFDPARNDYDVQVGVYLGADKPVQDAAAELQADSTQRIDKDPRWHNSVHGKIHDGVLTTDPFDMHLLGTDHWVPIFHFQDARLRLEVMPNGTAKGIVAGYEDVAAELFNSIKGGTYAFETFNTGSCPALYYAFKRFADGYPDPKTGECTAISSVYTIEAVPAFLVHPPADGKKTAEATPAQQSVATARETQN